METMKHISENIHKRKKTKVFVKIFVLILVCSQSTLIVAGTAHSGTKDASQENLLLGVEITNVHVPDIVIRCFSRIDVSVTVKNNRARPYFITINVFLKYENQFGTNTLRLIRSKLVMVRPFSEHNISIPCFLRGTFNEWYNRIVKFQIGNTFDEGSIGIQVLRGPHLLSHVLRKKIVNTLFNTVCCTIWKPVSLVGPFVKKDIIVTNGVTVPAETTGDGNFSTEVLLHNELPIDIPVFVPVFVLASAETIVGNIPRMWATDFGYLCGSYNGSIPKNSYKNITINCQFPKENFQPGYYDIRVIAFSYIPVEGTYNRFGNKLMWREFIRFSEYQRKTLGDDFWNRYDNYYLNVPILRSDSGFYSLTRYPLELGKIYFNTKPPMQKNIEDAINQGIRDVKNQTPYWLFLSFIIISFAALLYTLIKKYVH
jgi:hypothetical protein